MSKAEDFIKKQSHIIENPISVWISSCNAREAVEIAREEMIDKALITFQVVCNRPAKLLPNCETYCNACKQFKQAMKDE